MTQQCQISETWTRMDKGVTIFSLFVVILSIYYPFGLFAIFAVSLDLKIAVQTSFICKIYSNVSVFLWQEISREF